MDIASTKITNTTATNVSINCQSEQVGYKIDYFGFTFISYDTTNEVTIIFYHYTKHRSKQNTLMH